MWLKVGKTFSAARGGSKGREKVDSHLRLDWEADSAGRDAKERRVDNNNAGRENQERRFGKKSCVDLTPLSTERLLVEPVLRSTKSRCVTPCWSEFQRLGLTRTRPTLNSHLSSLGQPGLRPNLTPNLPALIETDPVSRTYRIRIYRSLLPKLGDVLRPLFKSWIINF